ncbi:SDR family NAD(P)-dependent oxidoreductase [Sinorhizobium medicae]|uniref:3-hydroxybutyrate dehydrogenase n=1 Tax=Sinorhizobium medicae TaxID=110321 RepID=UPI0012957970|nr:3-hydroxybutyrate dehydrogenase [Sinorhizobium medicae]MDX2388154.1 SDR family NAD(P)-dependent oxidoreductase [Sinorhizobium medicae]MQU73981.1 SDR family NAD(P)-dependent oxidoreductase [Sinorhizobium medicae]
MSISVPLHGKVALVTGSTSGIGLAIARMLATNGADVALNGFAAQNEIDEIIRGISDETGRRAKHFTHDLSDIAEASGLVAAVTAEFGKVDILVNNAGAQHLAAIDEFSDEEWQRLLAINLTAAFATTRAVWPQMKERGWGRIVNTASTLAFTAETRKSAYVATKHGVLGLTREVALEGAQLGITCNAVCPAWVLTPLVAKQVEAKAAELQYSFEEAARNYFLTDMPTRRFVETDEIAAGVLYLCGEAAKSITGIALPIDGGSLVG